MIDTSNGPTPDKAEEYATKAELEAETEARLLTDSREGQIRRAVEGTLSANIAGIQRRLDEFDGGDESIETYVQKKITLSTSLPSGGEDGDIWMVYSNSNNQ